MERDKLKFGCIVTCILYLVVILLMIVLWAVYLTKPIQ